MRPREARSQHRFGRKPLPSGPRPVSVRTVTDLLIKPRELDRGNFPDESTGRLVVARLSFQGGPGTLRGDAEMLQTAQPVTNLVPTGER